MMCNANSSPPQHRRVRSVHGAPFAPISVSRQRPASARRQRPRSADGCRCVTARSVLSVLPALPALTSKSPTSTTELEDVIPTFFKPVLTGAAQQRLQRPSRIDHKQKFTLGSLRRHNGTRTLDALKSTSHKHSSDQPPVKRQGAARDLWSAARQESGMPEPSPRRQSPIDDLKAARFLAGEPTVF